MSTLPFPRFERDINVVQRKPPVVQNEIEAQHRARFGHPFTTADNRINLLTELIVLDENDLDIISNMRENPGISLLAVGDSPLGGEWEFIYSIGMPYQYDQPEMIIVNSSRNS